MPCSACPAHQADFAPLPKAHADLVLLLLTLLPVGTCTLKPGRWAGCCCCCIRCNPAVPCCGQGTLAAPSCSFPPLLVTFAPGLLRLAAPAIPAAACFKPVTLRLSNGVCHPAGK